MVIYCDDDLQAVLYGDNLQVKARVITPGGEVWGLVYSGNIAEVDLLAWLDGLESLLTSIRWAREDLAEGREGQTMSEAADEVRSYYYATR